MNLLNQTKKFSKSFIVYCLQHHIVHNMKFLAIPTDGQIQYIYTYHLYLFYMAIQIQHSSCQIQCFINLRVETYWHHTTKKLFLDRHSKKTTLLEWVLWIINCTTKVSTRNNLHPCKLSQWFSLFQRSSKSLLDQLIAWHFIWAVQWVCRNELLYTTYMSNELWIVVNFQ